MKFYKLCRMVFVVFFLFLLGDAFYRWDGFKYYASIYEFLPSVALISVLWCLVSIITSTVVWFLLKFIYSTSKVVRIKTSLDHIFMMTGFFVCTSVLVLTGKRFLFPDIQLSQNIQLAILVTVALISVAMTWQLRARVEQLIEKLQDRITPLVWFFSLIVGISIPVVAFYAIWEPPANTTTNRNTEVMETNMSRPNIVLVTYDALTAKDMSIYGYHRDTTPFISKWSNTATVFNRCEAASTATYTAVPSLMTGKRVWTHGRYHADGGEPSKIRIESMPRLLKDSGYYNMAFTANDIASVKHMGLLDSFDVKPSFFDAIAPVTMAGLLKKNLVHYFGAKIKLYDWIIKDDFILNIFLKTDLLRYPYKTEYPAKKVYDMFFDELKGGYKEPFFAWIHLYPPHAPYLPPKEYVGLYNPSLKYRTAKSQRELINSRYYTKEQQADADIIRSRYDEFIRYCDMTFEYFITRLTQHKKLKNTVIMLSSDHGEGFEHGVFRHGSPTTMFEEMTNIPLIIKETTQKGGKVINFPVEMTDIPATILELARVPLPLWMEGQSLTPLLRGEPFQPRPVFSMDFQAVPVHGNQVEIDKGIISVWVDEYKLIYNIENKESLMYNLTSDPDELNNLFPSESEKGQRLLGLILDNLEKANERIRANNHF